MRRCMELPDKLPVPLPRTKVHKVGGGEGAGGGGIEHMPQDIGQCSLTRAVAEMEVGQLEPAPAKTKIMVESQTATPSGMSGRAAI